MDLSKKMVKVNPFYKIRREITVPSDKSISHRAVFISSLAKGKTTIYNFLNSEDTLASLECMRQLGVGIKRLFKERLIISSRGKYFPKRQYTVLNAYQSGTTFRLISGLLVGQPFKTKIEASGSLKKRPMKRITHPLRFMGARIKGRLKGSEEFPPLYIHPVKNLYGIRYRLPVSSAQVKSAIIFASLFAEGSTKIEEIYPSRDHTERMLKFFGAFLKKEKRFIYSQAQDIKASPEIFIPGDFSSAAFFITLGILLKDSELCIKKVGINPTRIGFLNVLKRMGARIKIVNKKNYFEPFADIIVSSSLLVSTVVRKEEIPLMIDEIPLLFVCASFAKGTTIIYGLKELKVKETDRISSMIYNLKLLGINIGVHFFKGDWCVVVKGIGEDRRRLKSGNLKSFGDHRTAMSTIIMGIASGCTHTLDDIQCINKSFPDFIRKINLLHKRAVVNYEDS